MLAGPQGMKFTSLRSRILCRALCTCVRVDVVVRGKIVVVLIMPHLAWIDGTLNDVEYRDVAALPRRCRHHDILSLCQPNILKYYVSIILLTVVRFHFRKQKRELWLASKALRWRSLQPVPLPPHDVQDRGLPDSRCGDFGQIDGRVSRHEEMAARGRDQRSHQADQVVVHIT